MLLLTGARQVGGDKLLKSLAVRNRGYVTLDDPLTLRLARDDPALFMHRVFSKLEGAVTAGMIHLGDKLGLYRALADAGRPLTTAELAGGLGLDERWVQEWAYNQGAAEIIQVDIDERLSLAPEAVVVLADAGSPSLTRRVRRGCGEPSRRSRRQRH